MPAQYVLNQSMRDGRLWTRFIRRRLVGQHNIVNHLQGSHQLGARALGQDRPDRLSDFHGQQFSRTRALTQMEHVPGQQRVEMT